VLTVPSLASLAPTSPHVASLGAQRPSVGGGWVDSHNPHFVIDDFPGFSCVVRVVYVVRLVRLVRVVRVVRLVRLVHVATCACCDLVRATLFVVRPCSCELCEYVDECESVVTS
jgi:hypothetical protein